MKKIICLLIVLSFLSCSTNQCINDYFEIENKKNKKSYGVLQSVKSHNSKTLSVYRGFSMPNSGYNYSPKYSNEIDYEYLKDNNKYDTLREYWKTNELKNFKFTYSTSKEYSTYRDKMKQNKIQTENYFYAISKPLHIKKKNIAIFYLHKTGLSRETVDDFVVIMRKEKGKYIVLEKMYNTALY
jgi:hypothetical protein